MPAPIRRAATGVATEHDDNKASPGSCGRGLLYHPNESFFSFGLWLGFCFRLGLWLNGGAVFDVVLLDILTH